MLWRRAQLFFLQTIETETHLEGRKADCKAAPATSLPKLETKRSVITPRRRTRRQMVEASLTTVQWKKWKRVQKKRSKKEEKPGRRKEEKRYNLGGEFSSEAKFAVDKVNTVTQSQRVRTDSLRQF